MNSFDNNTALSNESSGNVRPEELVHYPIIHHQPIHWGEMDAFNHLRLTHEVQLQRAGEK